MPLELHIIRSSEFVRLRTSGQLDYNASEKALAKLAQECLKRGVDRALLDLRDLPVPEQPLFTPTELASLIGTFREAGFTGKHRLAVLYRTDPHYGARVFAFIGSLRGWKVAAFEEFERALFWLSVDPEAIPEDPSAVVPIRRT